MIVESVICIPLFFSFMPRLSISRLHIEEEKLFAEISRTLSTARCWEERASSILASETQMYVLKELVRYVFLTQRMLSIS